MSIEKNFEKKFFFAKFCFGDHSLIEESDLPGLVALFPFPPTSLKHEFYGLTSGFTRLIMKIKYACYGLISLHANFHDNRTK